MNGLTAASWIERFVNYARIRRQICDPLFRIIGREGICQLFFKSLLSLPTFPASFSLIGGTFSFNVEWPPHLTRNSGEGGQMVPASRGIIDAV